MLGSMILRMSVCLGVMCGPTIVLGADGKERSSEGQPMDVGLIAQVPFTFSQSQDSLPSRASLQWFQTGEDGVVHVVPQNSFVRFRGWVNGGYTFNTDAPKSNFSGPYNAIDRDVPQFNQFYLIAERPLPQVSGEWGIGGRVDLLWGYDYFLTQSTGFERDSDGSPGWNANRYGLALPQIYGEVGSKDLSLKLGHFYTIIGYEGVPAINNFFYSKSYAYQFAGPFTHWGGMMSWRPTGEWHLQAGVHNGWDTFKRDVKNRPGVIVSAEYAHSSNIWSVGAALTTGDEPSAKQNDVANRTRYSVIAKIRPLERVEYVFHHHLAFQKDGKLSGGTSQWYGIDQYLYYTISQYVKTGLRFEWFRDDDGTRVSGSPIRGNPNRGPFEGNFYSLSVGLNVKPHANVLIRPEVRRDWFTGNRRPFDDGDRRRQWLLAINALVQF